MASGGHRSAAPTRAFTAPGRRDADRVREDDLAGARRREPRRQVATTPGSTSPSNGHPNEQLIVTVVGSAAAPRIRSTRSVASASDAFPLRRLKLSVAARVTLTRSSAVAASRS